MMTSLASRRLVAATAAFFSLAALAAPAEQCTLPANMPAAPTLTDSRSDVPVHDLQLVYSWSPYHCLTAGAPKGQQKKASHGVNKHHGKGHGSGHGNGPTPTTPANWDLRFQCAQNQFGFVVHGLWPQAEGATGKAGQPRACKPAAPIQRATLRKHLCTVPGVHLMQNEWMAHGTCHWDTPDAYFDTIESLRTTYPMPSLDDLQGKDVTVDDVIAAIRNANGDRLGADMIGVRTQQVKGRRTLQEVYVCLSLDQQPITCPSPGTPGHLNVYVEPVPKIAEK